MLLSAGRFDDARAVWERIEGSDHVVEPQHAPVMACVDAVLRWANDRSDAIRNLRESVSRLQTNQKGVDLELVSYFLARMGLRAGDTDAVRAAAALADEAPETAVGNPLTLALARWLRALARAQDTDDPGEAIRDVVVAADELEAAGMRLLAADALSDATLLADRHRLPEGNEWSARARALYEISSAVPVLDALRGRVDA
jgi:hypothetical protein